MNRVVLFVIFLFGVAFLGTVTSCSDDNSADGDSDIDADMDGDSDGDPDGDTDEDNGVDPIGCSTAGDGIEFDTAVEEVTFTSSADGLELSGTLIIPQGTGPFATIVLLHQYCSDRMDWTGRASNFGNELAELGFLVLAYDARGFGQSTDGGTLDYCGKGNPALFNPMLDDLSSALDFLATRAEANLDCLGLAGGSMGSSVVLIHGAQDERVDTVMLFSPGLNYLGFSTFSAISDFDPRPSLMFAAEDDSAPLADMMTLAKESENVTTVSVPGPDHGASIIGNNEEAHQRAIDWFSDLL